MYIPAIYENHDLDAVRAFIVANSFAILVNTTDGKPHATHIPLLLTTDADGNEVLSGHISKANPQWKIFEKSEDVLLIFSGAHAYISSSWYDHPNVPTWNYIAVHIYGKLRIVDAETVYNDLAKLVNHYEKASENPVSVATIGEQMVRREMRGVVGFHITINEIQAAQKLSQNRDDHNHTNIINALTQQNEPNAAGIAEEMRKMRE
jgi:transcriptional regulator